MLQEIFSETSCKYVDCHYFRFGVRFGECIPPCGFCKENEPRNREMFMSHPVRILLATSEHTHVSNSNSIVKTQLKNATSRNLFHLSHYFCTSFQIIPKTFPSAEGPFREGVLPPVESFHLPHVRRHWRRCSHKVLKLI